LSLLLMAIYVNLTKAKDSYAFEDEEEKEDTQAVLTSLKAKLLKRKKDPRPGESGSFVIGKHTYFLRVQPSAQNHNLEDYRYILSEVGLLEGEPKALEHRAEKLLCRVLLAAALHEHVEHVLVLIYGPPQEIPLAMDRQEDLVQVPCVARLRTPPSQPMGVVLPTLPTPWADGFVRHGDAAFA
jgi:hypothetical protein